MFAETLLDWFDRHGRDLPWRHTTDPYAVWLSEVILQQTRIQQGTAYWHRFIARWPTVNDLAAATEDEVLREWQGLGYYSRARNLHEAARQIVAQGGFPDSLESIRKLKGVGDYTAAAIASFAFGIPAAVVDGNVYRVLARHYGIDTPIDTPQGKRLFAELAQSLLPSDRPAAFNQALMDFGATQCTHASPRCADCPLQVSCDACRTDRTTSLPVKQRTQTIQTVRLLYIYIRCNGQTALRKRPAPGIWPGLWEPFCLPATEQDAPSGDWPQGVCRPLCGLPADGGKIAPFALGMRHALTHRLLIADFYLWEVDKRPPLPDNYIWVNERNIDSYALPRLIEKALAALQQ